MFKYLIVFMFFCQTVYGGFPPTVLKGQSDSTSPTTFNFVTPYNQATVIGASTSLFENGSNNLLANPSFEATSGITSWTAASGSVAADETTNIFAGKKSQLVTLTSVNGVSISQDVTPTIQMLGSNFEASVAIKTSLTTLQVCARQAASTFGTCATVQGDGNWHVYSVNLPGPSSGSVGVSVITTSSTSGTYYVDAGYVGLARNLGNGVPNNVFSAKISSTGVVSAENEDFINGNCTASAGVFTCNLITNKFSTPPNCAITLAQNFNITGGVYQSTSTTSQLSWVTVSNGAAANLANQLVCTRSSTDWVQPTIQAPNWDTDWTSYTPTIGATTTPPTPASGAVSSARWRRVGDSMEIVYTYSATSVTGAAAGSGTYLFPLPSGYTIDTSKVSVSTSGTSGGATVLGSASLSVTNTASTASATVAYVAAYNTANLQIIGYAYNSGLGANTTLPVSATYYALNTGAIVNHSFHAMVPISGWTKTLNAPLLVGSVTSNATGAERIERALVTCSSTSSITGQSDSLISSIGNISLGACSITLGSGFSSTPVCVATQNDTGNSKVIRLNVSSATAAEMRCYDLGLANNCTTVSANILCQGPR